MMTFWLLTFRGTLERSERLAVPGLQVKGQVTMTIHIPSLYLYFIINHEHINTVLIETAFFF